MGAIYMNHTSLNAVRITIGGALLSAIFALGACNHVEKVPDATANVRRALDQAGLKDVSVKDDRDKAVVTLQGKVGSNDQKSQAETVAKSNAGNQVVADEIEVVPPNDSSTAKKVDKDTDQGIEKNLDAALLQNHLKKNISYSVKNGVVTLKGYVDSSNTRSQVQNLAAQVPNVTQVVNELDVKYSRATSSR